MNATNKQVPKPNHRVATPEAQRVCALPEQASLFTQEQPRKTRARQGFMGTETPHKTALGLFRNLPVAARFKTIVWLKHAFAIPLTVERSPRPR